MLLANSAVDDTTACGAQPASAGFCISAPAFNLGVGICQQYPIWDAPSHPSRVDPTARLWYTDTIGRATGARPSARVVRPAWIGEGSMAKRNRRKYTRNEKIFYVLSLLIIISMVLSLVYVAITPM
jgi:hypothetical protein